MKLIRTGMVVLALGLILAFTAGCGEKDVTETAESEIATVQRGDLALDISAVGNLALSEKENLSFELAGTVTDVLVEEGDYIEEGEVMAKLDTSERDDHLKTLTRTIETKDQALLQAEINYDNAVDALAAINSQSYVDQKMAQAKLAVANAEISLASAEDAFEVAEDWWEQNWTVPDRIRQYEQKKAQLEIAELNLADTQEALIKVQADIDLERKIKEKELVIEKSKLEDAQKSLDDAAASLAEAENQRWNITAPFACFVTKVNAAEGSEIQKGATAIVVADPEQFEAEVYVSEMDIFNVDVGISATVQVDAAQTVLLPAVVDKISPSANIQSGVVNYAVTVKIRSMNAMVTERQNMMGEAMQQAAEAIEKGELPDMLQQAVDEGRMTQEQAEEMVERMQSGEFRGGFGANRGELSEDAMPPSMEGAEGEGWAMPEGRFTPRAAMFGGNATGSSFQVLSESGEIQLREGLTVTVSIITETRNDVVLVPSAAISNQGGQQVVTVVLSDETEEVRVIETGLSDWQNTEVLSGLTEGEQVVVPLGTSSTSSFEQQGGMFMPRIVGGGGR